MKNLLSIIGLFLTLSGSVFSQTLDESFAEGNVTDQQATDARSFIHQGKRDEAIQKGCSQEGLKDCNQSSVDRQGSVIQGNFGEALEQNIGKIYGMLGIFTGNQVSVVENKSDLAKVGTKDSNGKEVKKKDLAEKKMDYCILAAQGYELVSTSIQESLQNKITKDLEPEKDLQLKSLLALKKAHEARVKTSTYQSVIYGATGSCYVARAAASQGRVVMDAGYWIKMSASYALMGLYIAKATKHQKAAKLVQNVIDGLPGVGDCNPWTKTQCFCAEKTSKTIYPDHYEQICVLQKGETNPPQIGMACGVLKDGKMTIDTDCKCKQTNSCFKARISGSNLNFKLGGNFMNQANKGFDLLGSGEFDQGQFDQYAFQTGAYANKIKNKIETPANQALPKLNQRENAIADSLKGIMPPEVAALVAKSPFIQPAGGGLDSGLKAALANVPDQLKEKVGETEPLKYKRGGPGFGSEENDDPEISFQIPGQGEKENRGGIEVLSFAEKAINNNADVNTTPETPIFDIISNRYMRSGWNKLQAQEIK
jgi:hypothetical protein